MASLGKINTVPTYTLVLPSNNEEVKYRPYLHKEEKVLILAKESNDDNTYLQAIKDTIKACTFEELDVDNLPSFDIEELFLRIREKSVGETLQFSLVCQHPALDTDGNPVPDKICGCENDVSVKIPDITIDRTKVPTLDSRKIELTPNVAVELKFPSFDIIKKIFELRNIANEETLNEKLTGLLGTVIKCVYTKSDVVYLNEVPEAEVQEFLDNLTPKQIADILETLSDIPTVEHHVECTCKKCNRTISYDFNGIYSFFA